MGTGVEVYCSRQESSTQQSALSIRPGNILEVREETHKTDSSKEQLATGTHNEMCDLIITPKPDAG
jgi:hypothetical protein